MLLIPPIAAYCLMCLACYAWRGEWRASLLSAGIAFSAFLVFLTECLSAFSSLTPIALAAAWAAVAAGVLVLYIRMPKPHRMRLPDTPKDTPAAWKAIMIFTAAIVAVVGITAFAAAPNVWDSMQYHLPRVAEWAVHKSVRFYPTPDYQQLFAPPFTEFAMLQGYLLFGGDAVVSLIQWLAWIGSGLAASLIVRFWTPDLRAQILAFIISLTIPNAILSASGPKNDCVVAFWVVATVWLLLEYRRRQSWLAAAGIGASLGLAILTKGTAFLFLPCFFLAYFLPLFVWRFRKTLLLDSAAIALCAFAINLPQFVRNRELTGSVLGFSSVDGEGRFPWRNSALTFRGTMSNVFRNLLCHFGTRSPAFNAKLISGSRSLLRSLSIDPDDPSTTWAHDRFTIYPFARHEIFSGSPIQIGLFLVSLAALLIAPGRLPRGNLAFALAIVAGFFVFCMVLRYQSWNARLHLPLLALASCTIAVVASGYLRNSGQLVLAGSLLLIAVPNALGNDLRPVFTRPGLNPGIFEAPREEVYFYDQHQRLARSYLDAADAVQKSGCRTVGIDASEEHFEYPLFALLHDRNISRVVYSGVVNRSSRYSARDKAIAPCAIICPGCAGNPAKLALYHRPGSRTLDFGRVAVFLH